MRRTLNLTAPHPPRRAPWALVAALAALVLMSACAGSSGNRDTLTGPQPLNSVTILDDVVHLIPQESDGVVIVDMNRLMNHHLVTAFGLIGEDWNHEQMTADLKRLFLAHYGLDFTQARWALLSGDETPLLLVQGDMGTPPAAMKQQVAGVTAFVNPKLEGFHLIPIANHKDLYAICTDADQVKQVAAVQQGQHKSLKGSAQLARMKMLLDRVGPGDLTVVSLLENVDEEVRAGVPLGIGQTTGAFGASVSDRLVVAIQGDPKELDATAGKIREAIETFREGLKEELNAPAAQVEDPNKLIASTWLYHVSGALSEQIAPTQEGDLLVYDVSMNTLTHPVTIIGGIVAAVAWAFGEFLGNMNNAFPAGPATPPPPTSGLDGGALEPGAAAQARPGG